MTLTVNIDNNLYGNNQSIVSVKAINIGGSYTFSNFTLTTKKNCENAQLYNYPFLSPYDALEYVNIKKLELQNNI